MCFYIQKGKNSKPKVAKQNITCYKVFYRSDCSGNQHGSYVKSYYQSFKYKIGVLYELDGYMVPIKGYRNDTIEVGLHSYSTRAKAFREKGGWDYKVIHECIIPKGSIYYHNDYKEEYVSDQIIIVKRHV